jgi:hypothetical protein
VTLTGSPCNCPRRRRPTPAAETHLQHRRALRYPWSEARITDPRRRHEEAACIAAVPAVPRRGDNQHGRAPRLPTIARTRSVCRLRRAGARRLRRTEGQHLERRCACSSQGSARAFVGWRHCSSVGTPQNGHRRHLARPHAQRTLTYRPPPSRPPNGCCPHSHPRAAALRAGVRTHPRTGTNERARHFRKPAAGLSDLSHLPSAHLRRPHSQVAAGAPAVERHINVCHCNGHPVGWPESG